MESIQKNNHFSSWDIPSAPDGRRKQLQSGVQQSNTVSAVLHQRTRMPPPLMSACTRKFKLTDFTSGQS
ncbi:hypothetical protein LSH36_99g07021 [Paralvinella palmiformis]|uniref:Uncharacterized protein n=1 Tax=Paralvinella palmiformis TaxID=53620 RepID=A0AAD9K0G2_9ANNE|nr:hypothetical protein LSH36_99g07021 [Paralvinella palmiformis]